MKRLACIALLLLPIGCEQLGSEDDDQGPPPTSVVVAIDSNATADFDRLYVHAARGKSHEKVYENVSFPTSIVFTCSDDYSCDDYALTIDVVARLGETQDVISRRARLNYVDDRAVFLQMPLCADCKAVECSSSETCRNGLCVSRDVDALALPDDDEDLSLGHGGACDVTPCNACGECGMCPDAAQQAVDNYAIDVHEVTRDQYAQFLASNPSMTLSDSIGGCSWNKRFQPDENCMQYACEGDGCGQHPQVCVDWCDAASYCQWAGKRLCGKIGGGALGYTGEEYKNPALSQWHNACSPSGTDFPYGASYQSTVCNDQQAGLQSTVAVGGSPNCVAGGVYDMSGNVAEWEDGCSVAEEPTQSDSCRLRGGSFFDGGDYLKCEASDVEARNHTSSGLGFRCCSG